MSGSGKGERPASAYPDDLGTVKKRELSSNLSTSSKPTTMTSGERTHEYLTVHRNATLIIKSLAGWGDPGLFTQKLCEADLVSRDVLEGACTREVTASKRIQRVINAVQSQINLESSNYNVFMRILNEVHPQLAQKLSKYFTTNLELNAPRAVSSVCNWKELAHQIDYDPIKLTRLQSSGYSPEKCREELVTDWARQEDASWEKLARALDRMNEAHLAEEIRRQYLPSPEHEDDSSASARDDLLTMSPRTDSDVAREIKDLENRFRDLVFAVQMEIEDEMEKGQTFHKRWAIRKLQNNLSYLPADIRPDHYEFVRENLDTISEAESVHKIFNYLNLYWSFIDCNLLEHLISKFGSEGLQAQMASYIADVVNFRKSTTVSQFAKHWPRFGGKKDPPPHFSELKAKLPDDPSSCTLEYVENLRVDFCREFFLSKSALVLAGVNPGSVVVVWYVPSSVTPVLSAYLSTYEEELFQGYGVTELRLSQFFDHLCGIQEKEVASQDSSAGLESPPPLPLQFPEKVSSQPQQTVQGGSSSGSGLQVTRGSNLQLLRTLCEELSKNNHDLQTRLLELHSELEVTVAERDATLVKLHEYTFSEKIFEASHQTEIRKQTVARKKLEQQNGKYRRDLQSYAKVVQNLNFEVDRLQKEYGDFTPMSSARGSPRRYSLQPLNAKLMSTGSERASYEDSTTYYDNSRYGRPTLSPTQNLMDLREHSTHNFLPPWAQHYGSRPNPPLQRGFKAPLHKLRQDTTKSRMATHSQSMMDIRHDTTKRSSGKADKGASEGRKPAPPASRAHDYYQSDVDDDYTF